MDRSLRADNQTCDFSGGFPTIIRREDGGAIRNFALRAEREPEGMACSHFLHILDAGHDHPPGDGKANSMMMMMMMMVFFFFFFFLFVFVLFKGSLDRNVIALHPKHHVI